MVGLTKSDVGLTSRSSLLVSAGRSPGYELSKGDEDADSALALEIREQQSKDPRLISAHLLGRKIENGEWWQYMKELAYEHPAAILFVARQVVGSRDTHRAQGRDGVGCLPVEVRRPCEQGVERNPWIRARQRRASPMKQAGFKSFLEENGLGEADLTRVLRDSLQATKVVATASENGKITDVLEREDHTTRLRAVEIGWKLHGRVGPGSNNEQPVAPMKVVVLSQKAAVSRAEQNWTSVAPEK